jgi:hypothetical protein
VFEWLLEPTALDRSNAGVGNMEAAHAQLLDFSGAFNVGLLDQVIEVFYNAAHPQVRRLSPAFLLYGS